MKNIKVSLQLLAAPVATLGKIDTTALDGVEMELPLKIVLWLRAYNCLNFCLGEAALLPSVEKEAGQLGVTSLEILQAYSELCKDGYGYYGIFENDNHICGEMTPTIRRFVPVRNLDFRGLKEVEEL